MTSLIALEHVDAAEHSHKLHLMQGPGQETDNV